MLNFREWAFAATAAVLLPVQAWAAAPVKHIDIYVTPYYESATKPGQQPKVAVGKGVSEMLSSNNVANIVAVRDAIQANPGVVTPMTMMVLAIRLYDMGMRDDSVFWFYVAKDRYVTLREVTTPNPAMFGAIDDAMGAFVNLAGPAFNGYAFCNIPNQERTGAEALDWVEKHPYAAIFMPQIPAKPGDRAANLKNAIAELRAGAKKEDAYVAANLADIRHQRQTNDMDAKYCWK
ncbi:MAG TPA: hypothetical protein VHW02_01905 [Rhizomicrobium sp.]|jgi:hypothetical protein|nr:hypothetical protein [Rhizomicrobium sp.]